MGHGGAALFVYSRLFVDGLALLRLRLVRGEVEA